MIDTILLDLDGTLMPIDQDTFTKAYFSEMLKKVIPLGYEKQSYIDALWKGTAAMAANDGSKTNRDRFWAVSYTHLWENSIPLIFNIKNAAKTLPMAAFFISVIFSGKYHLCLDLKLTLYAKICVLSFSIVSTGGFYGKIKSLFCRYACQRQR